MIRKSKTQWMIYMLALPCSVCFASLTSLSSPSRMVNKLFTILCHSPRLYPTLPIRYTHTVLYTIRIFNSIGSHHDYIWRCSSPQCFLPRATVRHSSLSTAFWGIYHAVLTYRTALVAKSANSSSDLVLPAQLFSVEVHN